MVDIEEAEYNGLIDALQMPQFETETFYSFRTYGVCLQACDDNSDCTREGYRCVVPLGDFVSLVESIGARLETYCVGTPEGICEDACVNGSCTEDEDTSVWTCECESGYTGVNCDQQVPGLCPFFDVTAPLQVSATGYDEGEIATFSCAQGFSLVGNETRTCQADGTWTGTLPTCDSDPCAGNPCVNGGTCSSSTGSAVCTGCDAGWSGNLCDVPADCGALSATAPLMVSTTVTTLNGVATYTCSGTLVLTGNGTRTCQADGTWSGSAPTCEEPPMTCTPNPCDNGGTCIADGSGNFESCACASGWTGATCAVPVTCDVLSPTTPLNVSYSDAQDAGSVATYTCGTGYSLQGTATRTCVDSAGTGMWSGTAPTCQRIMCPTLAVSAPLQVSTAETDFGTTVTYSCATGYNLASAGPSSTTCGASGWSPAALPTCEIVTCPALTNPSNGTVDDGNNQYDTTASYSCNTGYEVTGGTAVRCSASGTWTGTPPACARVSCPARTAPGNGTITPAGPYDYQDTITYMCNSGFSLSGGDATQTCLASGNWSSTAPSCSAVLCPALSAPANGTVDDMSRTPGTVASYACSSGYGLSSAAAVTCQANGTWMGTPPTCNLLDCGAPPAANANGTRVVPGVTTVGAVTMYSCNTGYTGGGDVTCQSSGSWSAASAPACTIVSCGAPPAVTNGSVGAGANTYNSSRTYSCSNGYQIAGSASITCQASGNWTSAPTCELIPDGCSPNPCQNGGTCTESGGTFTGCTNCNAGYTGSLCDTPVDCGPLTVTNGTVAYVPTNTTLGSVATTTCTAGYVRGGPTSRTCQANGSWSGAVNTCTPVDCGAAPDGTNSTATETSTSLNGTATYTCAAGHVVSGGDATRTCGTNGMWTGTPLSCSLGDCGAPAAAGANASVATPGGTNTGDTATYTCNTGFGSGTGVASRTCAVSAGVAAWTPTGASLSCSPVSCGSPPAGSNSTVSFTTTNYNDTAMYTCTSGYTGGPSTITCQANGNWSGGGLNCTPVSCGAAPAANANGTVSGSGTTYNSTRMYSCNSGYTGGGTLTCLSSGSWSGTTPACTLVDPYCSPTAPANGSVSGGTTLGSVATYSCITGYSVSAGNAMRTCNANGATGTLSGTQPTCSPVSCGAAPDGTNSTATETSTVYNGLATYTCNSGYVASTGNATRTCGAGGTWSGSALNCVIGDCGPAPAAGANATLTMTGGTTSGATASYACNAGSGMGTGVASRTCQVTSGVAGWTPTGASLACVATPTTCNLVYDFGAPPGGGARFRIDPQTTIASAATRNIGAGKIVLRVAADSNGRPATSGAIEVLYYDMDQYFSLSGVTTETRICLLNPASAVPTVPTSAPPPEQNMMAACITPSNTTPMATGTFTRTGGTGTATFSCYDPAPTGNNYTPAQATGTAAGCLTRWFSYGRIFCNGLCGLVLPQNVWIDKSAQWSQHLLPLNLSSNLATLTMGNGGGSARGDFAHVPNTDNGWTGFALSGAVNTSESTCVLTGL